MRLTFISHEITNSQLSTMELNSIFGSHGDSCIPFIDRTAPNVQEALLSQRSRDASCLSVAETSWLIMDYAHSV